MPPPEIRGRGFRPHGRPYHPSAPRAEADWRTILVAGQGKGGRSFIAMDVTNITDTLTEDEIAGRVLWEFTHPDMGFSFGRPLIAKTLRWGWVVILTGGYNNIGGTKRGRACCSSSTPRPASCSGRRRLYRARIRQRILAVRLRPDRGLHAQLPEYILDYVYGGDLHGNLWRFDFSNASDDLRRSPRLHPSAPVAPASPSPPRRRSNTLPTT